MRKEEGSPKKNGIQGSPTHRQTQRPLTKKMTTGFISKGCLRTCLRISKGCLTTCMSKFRGKKCSDLLIMPTLNLGGREWRLMCYVCMYLFCLTHGLPRSFLYDNIKTSSQTWRKNLEHPIVAGEDISASFICLYKATIKSCMDLNAYILALLMRVE